MKSARGFSRVLWAVPVALLACGDDGGGTEGTESETATSTSTASTTDSSPTTTLSTTDSTTNSTTDSTTDSTSTTTDTETTGTGTETGGIPPCPYDEVGGSPSVGLELVADGFAHPVFAIGHPQVPDRLFVVEQVGNVKILEPGETNAPADNFLSVGVAHNSGSMGDERGLLGFAFHPDFPTDPRVYIKYNPSGGSFRTTIEEYTLDGNDPNQVDPNSARIVMEIDQPQGNHNGGMIAFGSDGYLYIGMGDGGGSEDSHNTSRAPQYLLAKILRIGVETDGNMDMTPACANCNTLGPFDYTVPADNPFVGDPNFAPEIWAWGMRNPYRMAFDPVTDVLYVGDVGQYQWEEISVVDPGNDYGWVQMEGNHCGFQGPCDTNAGPNETNSDGQVAPIAEYSHSLGNAVIGGSVYRSCEVTNWEARYFYADWGSGRVFALDWDGQNVNDLGEVHDSSVNISGNGWNAWGDVYFTAKDDSGFEIEGHVYRLAPQ